MLKNDVKSFQLEMVGPCPEAALRFSASCWLHLSRTSEHDLSGAGLIRVEALPGTALSTRCN